MSNAISYTSTKATIQSILDDRLEAYSLSWHDVLYGEITKQLKACMRDVINTSVLTERMLITSYTNLSYQRLEYILNTPIKISIYE
jgi:hypothetical protein